METANFLGQLSQQMLLSAPLFSLIALGYCLGRFAGYLAFEGLIEAARVIYLRFRGLLKRDT